MKTAIFLFKVEDKYFPNVRIIQPFYMEVEYAYLDSGVFSEVTNVKISAKAIGIINLTRNLLDEITEAARNNLNSLMTEEADDLKGVL